MRGPRALAGGIQLTLANDDRILCASISINPGNLVFHDGHAFPVSRGDMLMAAMSRTLLRVQFGANGKPIAQERKLTELGQRLRDVRKGPDGLLYAEPTRPRAPCSASSRRRDAIRECYRIVTAIRLEHNPPATDKVTTARLDSPPCTESAQHRGHGVSQTVGEIDARSKRLVRLCVDARNGSRFSWRNSRTYSY